MPRLARLTHARTVGGGPCRPLQSWIFLRERAGHQRHHWQERHTSTMTTFIALTGRHMDAALIVRRSFVLAVFGILGVQVDDVSAISPIRIECIGDSITAGYTDNPTWNLSL